MFLCSVLSQGRIASVQGCSRNELNRGMDAFVLFHFPEMLPVSKPNLTSSHQDFSRQRKFQLWEGAWFGGFYTPNLTGERVTALSCSFLLHRHCTPRYHCWLPSLPPSVPALPYFLQHSWRFGKRYRARDFEIKCGIPARWESIEVHSSMVRISPKTPILHIDQWNYIKFLGFCDVLNQLGTKG